VIAVDVFRKALRRIASQKGDFTLFALFRRANGIGEWDLVVSAPWLQKSRYQAVSELVDLLSKSIGRKSLVELARVEPIPTKDPNLKSLLAEFPDDGEPERRIRNIDLFGLEMEEAIILRAKRSRSKKPAPQALQARRRRFVRLTPLSHRSRREMAPRNSSSRPICTSMRSQ
jgi:hypothetical protein